MCRVYGAMGLKPGDGGAAEMGAAPAGGGGLLVGLLNGIMPTPVGPLKSESPHDASSQFMPTMPNGGGGSGIPFAALAGLGQAAKSVNVPRMPQGMRPLPH